MKCVLVTGASSGIGRSIAEKFHQSGYFVYLLARDQSRLKDLNSQLKNSSIVTCDLNDSKQIEALPKQIDFSKIDILINNAGIYLSNLNEFFLASDWQSVFQVNLFASAQLSALLFPYFKQKQCGSIVMVSSTLAHRPAATTAAYSASKAALQNLTMTLALEGAPYSIRVNCVSPGIVETPIHKWQELPPDQRLKIKASYDTLQPLARVGQPKNIAEAVYFLGSESSSWTTGAILNVDGGINIK